MKYTYLYQTKGNENRSGEIEARNRAEAYAKLRKMGVRPYRVIGDDPYDWRPILSWGAIGVAVVTVIMSGAYVYVERQERSEPLVVLSPEEAVSFRRRAESAVLNAPPIYRYNVWRGVNARLKDRGLEPIPRPPDMVEDEYLAVPGGD